MVDDSHVGLDWKSIEQTDEIIALAIADVKIIITDHEGTKQRMGLLKSCITP